MAVPLFQLNWWAIALRGVCGIVFGIIALARPGAAIAALVLVFGAYALIDGVFAVFAAIRNRRTASHWIALLLGGIVGIIVGIWAFVAPAVTVVALVLLVATWAVILGALEVVAAVRLRKAIQREWLLGLAGALSIVFGVLLWRAPIAGAVVLAVWIGAYFLIAGAIQLVLAFRLRRWSRLTEEHPDVLAA